MGLAVLVGAGLLAAGATSRTAGVAGQLNAPLIHTLHGYARSLAFSGDGRLLVSADDSIKLWDARAGRLLKVFSDSGAVDVVDITRDGKFVASVTSVVKLWDSGTGQLIREMASEPGTSACCRVLAISPDGHFLVGTSGYPSHLVRVWDAGTGALMRKLGDDPYYTETVRFSPDGRILAVSAMSEHKPVLDLWDVPTGRLVKRLGAGNYPVSLSYSPDGGMVATVEAYRAFRTLVLWDVRRGRKIFSPLTISAGSEGGPVDVASSPSGRYLAVAWSLTDNGPRAIRLWDLRRHMTVLTLDVDAHNLAFSPDGALLAAIVGQDIMLWDVRQFSGP